MSNTYDKQYYQKNKDKINARSIQWQKDHHAIRAAYVRKHRNKNKEKYNELWRRRYKKRKEKIENEYGIMGRNIRNDRVQLYLSNPEYYKEKLAEKIDKEKLEIAYYYLDDATHSLFATGKIFHKSKERIRQIVHMVLFKVSTIKLDKKEIMEEDKNTINEEQPVIEQVYVKTPTHHVNEEDFMYIKRLVNESASLEDIKEKTGFSRSIVNRIKAANSFAEYQENNHNMYLKYHKEYRKHLAIATKDTHIPYPRRGSPLTQEEFDKVKEILYTGEIIRDIAHMTGHSSHTIGHVKKATTFGEYQENRRKENRVYLVRRNKIIDSPSPTQITFKGVLPVSPSSHRQALADAIDIFIKEEVKIKVQMELDRIAEEMKRRYEN